MSDTGVMRASPESRRVANAVGYPFLPPAWRRVRVLVWLRRVHGWLGLWGGVAGMLFGATGILLNHRAQMPIEAVKTQQMVVRLALRSERPETPQALAAWVKGELGLQNVAIRVQRSAAHAVAWSEKPVIEPEHWQATLWNPARTVQADYWLGMAHVNVRQTSGNGLSVITRLHMAEGVHAGWILVTDTVAGGLVALALSGILLWTRLHGPRLLAVTISGTVAALLVTFGLMSV
jgi:hypothetical protein